ncbi:MAG: methyltransferase [Nitrospinae bacterium]|nr:methyltransferase [Nitrospinota bacterium]
MRKITRLDQDKAGYRYNRDSFILAGFLQIKGGSSVIDMGAGVGALSILAGLSQPDISIVALELDHKLLSTARKNAESNRIKRFYAVAGDMTQADRLFPGRAFDAVISNPPYRKAGTGRINPDPGKAMARHEIKMTLEGLVKASSAILKNEGALYITMLYERRDEYLALIQAYGFSERRYRLVCSFPLSAPSLFLSEARLSPAPGTVVEEPPMILKSTDGGDSEEFNAIMARFVGP